MLILLTPFHNYTLYLLVEFNRFPELSRTSGLFQDFPVLENANKIQGLSRLSRTHTNPAFMWEKGRGYKCCPGPKSCLPRARPVLRASISEWHIRPVTVRWVSQGTEAGWRVPMPSSRRDGSEGKWMCPPFLTQAKTIQASLQCRTEGLLPAKLIPQTIYQQLKWYYKNRLFFTIDLPGYNITNGTKHLSLSALLNCK